MTEAPFSNIPPAAARAAAAATSAPPLAVDLDGTLALADTLHEGLLACLRERPLGVHRLLSALRRGRAAFKEAVSGSASFDPVLLPYNAEVLDYLRTQHAAGRRIGLFTAADQSIAEAIAAHLGFFDVARGSDGATNLSGAEKVRAIRETFGERFAYAGDSAADRPVFDHAEQVVLVGPAARLAPSLSATKRVEAVFPKAGAGLRTWAKAVRLQHWSKNLLVFVAPVLGLHLSPAVIGHSVLLFVLMGLLASATYLVNDLFDLVADRQHPKKRHRPLASGAITAREGAFAAFGMSVGALGLGMLLLPPVGSLSLCGYLAITLAYSFGLKRQPFVDVSVLAGLFTLRVLAGSLIVPGPVSAWLLTFSMLFFLGLAMIKRYAELNRVLAAGGDGVVARGYTVRDLPLLLASGVASGFAAIAIFMIYLINEQYPRDIYGRPELLWAMMPVVVVWTLRMWHLTVHGRMDEDPVVFALRDRTSLALAAFAGATLMLAWS
jgi:4-hydroxybenzoate polyprenyltransferase/phosphoserine phosphatase